MRDQPTRALIPEPLDAAGDEIGSVAAQDGLPWPAQRHTGVGVGYENKLADMARRLHQPKGVFELSERENAVRQRTDFAIEECPGDFGQQLAGEIRPANRQLIDVDGEVRDVLSERA